MQQCKIFYPTKLWRVTPWLPATSKYSFSLLATIWQILTFSLGHRRQFTTVKLALIFIGLNVIRIGRCWFNAYFQVNPSCITLQIYWTCLLSIQTFIRTGETRKRKGSWRRTNLRRTNLRLEFENGGIDVDQQSMPGSYYHFYQCMRRWIWKAGRYNLRQVRVLPHPPSLVHHLILVNQQLQYLWRRTHLLPLLIGLIFQTLRSTPLLGGIKRNQDGRLSICE